MSAPGHRLPLDLGKCPSLNLSSYCLFQLNLFFYSFCLFPTLFFLSFPASHPIEDLEKFLRLLVKDFNALVFLFSSTFMIACYFDLRLLLSPAPKMVLFPDGIVLNTYLFTLESFSAFLLCLSLEKLLIISDVICS